MAVRSGTRILSMEGSRYDYELYIGGRRARFGLPAEGLHFLYEPSVLWRIKHRLVEELGGRVHAISRRELPQFQTQEERQALAPQLPPDSSCGALPFAPKES